MVNSIGSSSVASLMQRPDPSQMANKLFSKLDSKNQGYIEKSDLQSAFDQISGAGNSGSTASVEEVFKQLDGNGDGKVTKQEMSDSLTKMAKQLDSQFNNMRTSGQGGMGGMQGMGGMPPPPPPQGSDSAGLTKGQLTSMAKETGSTDSKLTNLVNNFDKADTNGDGKVSMQEAMAFDQASKSSSSDSTSTDSSSTTSSTSNSEANVMMRIMQLMHAYGGFGMASDQSSKSGTLSTSA